jgi:putative CocE/NonD family hydrolase
MRGRRRGGLSPAAARTALRTSRVAAVTTSIREIRELDPVWIPVRDGCRLAAKIWLPVDADTNPVPAVLEYIPYRRRDFTAPRDALLHPYVAAHGYACVRVDMRGSGDSEGVLTGEYLPLEQDDALDVIAWVAAQRWCTGRVGMMGHSWGGFNALQVAARRPPQLAAIITSCSTDDRYADDVHYMGGCLLLENLTWGTTMLAMNGRPPDPQVTGERWRTLWLERLQGGGLWLDPWFRHQRRDTYWKHGSVCEDYSAVRCPVYAVGGWADAYTNAVPRLMRGLSVSRRALIGPWGHRYPHMAAPGPALGFPQLAVDWWNMWLKESVAAGAGEPVMRIWMQDSVPPAHTYRDRPGRWIAEQGWPPAGVRLRRLSLTPGRLEPQSGPEAALTVRSPQTVGLYAGQWCPYGGGLDLPVDQRLENAGSLGFETALLSERLEILGAPVVEVEVAADRPVALLAARLLDIAPGGAATRVTYGVLNLTHRDGHERPEPLVPGRRYRVRLSLNDVAQSFPPGHRIGLALSTAYWPIVWPAPESVTLTVFTSGSVLELPVRPPDPAETALPPLPAVEPVPGLPVTILEPAKSGRTIMYDLAADTTTLEVLRDAGVYRLDTIDLTVHMETVHRYSIRPDDPGSARADCSVTVQFARDDWRIETRARSQLTSTPEVFRLEAGLEAFEGDERIFSTAWDRSIPRDLV